MLRRRVRDLLKLFRHRISRFAGWLIGGTGIQALVGFGSNLVLVRLLLPDDFGRFAIVQANVALAAIIVNFKVEDLVFRLPEEDLDRAQMGVYGAALVVESFGIIVVAIGVLGIVDLLSVEAFILLGGSVASSWILVETRLYERRFEYRNLSIIETLSYLGAHLFAVAGALIGWGAIVLYLRVPIRQLGRVIGLGSVQGLQAIPIRWPERRDWRNLFQEARAFWGDAVLGRGFERAVILVVASLTGERVTGYFFQARRLAIVPHQLLQPVSYRMAFNYFSREESSPQRHRVLDTSLKIGFVVLAVVATVAYALSEPVIPWLFGERWRPVVPLFRAMTGVIIGLTLFATLQAYHMALGRMGRFVAVGRSGQYAIFLLAALVGVAGLAPSGVVLAYGLSASFLVPTVVLSALPRVRKAVEECTGPTG